MILFIDNATGGNKMQNVAQTILEQLGGNRFAVMTGAKDFLDGGTFVQFGIGRGAKSGINKVKIQLEMGNTYRVEFWKIRGLDARVVEMVENVYADNLARVFTEHTGFDTHL